MKTESKTPRTDAQITGLVRLYPQSLCQTEVVSATFCRDMETELNAAKLKAEGDIWGLGLEMGKLKTECDAWKKCAMQLADSGDPKPWKIEEWNAAKKKTVAEPSNAAMSDCGGGKLNS